MRLYAKQPQHKEGILKYLQGTTFGQMSLRKIAADTGTEYNACYSALKALSADGLVEKFTMGKMSFYKIV